MAIQRYEKEMKIREGPHMIFPSNFILERFDETFLDLPNKPEFFRNIIEIAKISAALGKPSEKFPFDTDHFFQREFIIPIEGKGTDSYVCTIDLFRDIHESKIRLREIGQYPRITLVYRNDGIVSLELNPKEVKEANEFEEPQKPDKKNIKDVISFEGIDERDIYLVRNIDIARMKEMEDKMKEMEDEMKEKGTSGLLPISFGPFGMEISGPPQLSFGPKSIEFINAFTNRMLEAFKKKSDEKDPQNKTNLPIIINLN
ncbi:MAG: hypothetical protein Q7K55_06175 [Candidatus Levybacteria bacterium]|nr:hypothetical protein [Candidatus Levybacteria bacterium]